MDYEVCINNEWALRPRAPITVMHHGDVAVAYVSIPRSKDGKTFSVYNTDYCIRESGAWRAYLPQQSQF